LHRYTNRMIRYAITDGTRFRGGGGGEFAARRDGLLEDARRWANAGVEFVQLREKDLAAGELVDVAMAMMRIFRESGGTAKLLVNGSLDVVREAGADGVHLAGARMSGAAMLAEKDAVARARELLGRDAVVSVSCHSVEEVRRARGADLILFGPVFEKRVAGEVVVEGVGIGVLREACAAAGGAKVLALGGVHAGNAPDCVRVGAAGVAAIRMFQAAGDPE